MVFVIYEAVGNQTAAYTIVWTAPSWEISGDWKAELGEYNKDVML